MTKYQALILVESATGPASLFHAGNPEDVYLDLLKLIHPDRFPADGRPRADAAARKLAELYHQVNGKAKVPIAKVGDWEVTAPFAKGNVADLYMARNGDQEAVLKV